MALTLKKVSVMLMKVAVLLLKYCWHKYFRVLVLHHLLWLVLVRLLLLMMIQDIFVVLYTFFLLLLKSFFAQKIFVSFDYWPVVCVTPYHLHQSNPSGLYLFVQEKNFVFFNCSNIHCFCMCNVKRTFQLL